jgi:hypothetical protein
LSKLSLSNLLNHGGTIKTNSQNAGGSDSGKPVQSTNDKLFQVRFIEIKNYLQGGRFKNSFLSALSGLSNARTDRIEPRLNFASLRQPNNRIFMNG